MNRHEVTGPATTIESGRHWRRPTQRVRHYVDGRWTDAISGRTFDSHSPWSGETVAVVAAGDVDDARAAIAAAHRAFPSWAATTPHLRQEIFLRAAEGLDRRRAEVLALLASETGCTATFARVQIDFAAGLLRQCAALPYATVGHVMPSDVEGTTAYAYRRPVGVVGAIAPWNASLSLSARAIAGPLALGNTVVLKPSEESPVSAGALWAELFEQAGLPGGVLNVVTHAPGEAGAVGDEFIVNPWVRRINFTGSTPTGRRLAEAAGRQLKRVVLQLSGHNPMIVLDGVDLDYAADAAAYGSFVHQGQVCMCARRIYVERTIHEEFTRRFAAKAAALPLGDPADPSTVIGPLINQWAQSLMTRRVDEAVARGARIVSGGVAEPPCFPPTILTEVPADVEVAFEETFGPVVILDVVDDAAQAVERANASPFGLAASILCGSADRGAALARSLEAGIVHVDDQSVNDEPAMPFGGMKDSGWGRFGTGFAAEEFTELQWVTTRTDRRNFPF